jgi:hypothetical protein
MVVSLALLPLTLDMTWSTDGNSFMYGGLSEAWANAGVARAGRIASMAMRIFERKVEREGAWQLEEAGTAREFVIAVVFIGLLPNGSAQIAMRKRRRKTVM